MKVKVFKVKILKWELTTNEKEGVQALVISYKFGRQKQSIIFPEEIYIKHKLLEVLSPDPDGTKWNEVFITKAIADHMKKKVSEIEIDASIFKSEGIRFCGKKAL